MARPTSRNELIEYCLRNLGAPVIEINVDDEQLEDRFDEALQFYQEYHSDAVIRTLIKHQLTQEEITSKSVELPDAVLSVTKILNINDTSANNMFNVKYQMYLNDIYNLRKGASNLIGYAMTKEYLGLIDQVLGGSTQQLTYARHQNTLEILTDWDAFLNPGEYIIIECYQTVNPLDFPEVYNDMALKKYLTSLIKKQWGQNLLKFEGMQLPGGVQINGRPIYEDAVNEITKLEDEWESRYSAPIGFFVG